jgi:hypothetical protein
MTVEINIEMGHGEVDFVWARVYQLSDGGHTVLRATAPSAPPPELRSSSAHAANKGAQLTHQGHILEYTDNDYRR